MKQVLVTAPFPDSLIDKIKAVSPDVTVEQISLPDRSWPEGRATTADILYATSAVPDPEAAPNLRWIQTHWAGIDSLFDTAVWESDILITTASGIHAPNMAQYALTMVLAWAHRVPIWFRNQQAGTWPKGQRPTYMPDELRGRTLGIVGYGSIGRELARLAKPLGMKILVAKRDARHIEDDGYTLPGCGDPHGTLPDRIYPGEALHSMLAECDYAVLTLPLTERTRHLIDASMLRDMKPTSFLVNIGRGAVIKEADLVRALQKGWIAGAGLDVFEQEPLPDSSPLWRMDNVILTPHISGMTAHYDERAVDLFTANLRRYLAGEPLFNLVERGTGY